MAQQLLNDLMEGWDEDMRLPETLDLRKLKVLRSEVRNLKPLTLLCLKSVVLNIGRLWYKDYLENWSDQDVAFLLGPFDDLRKINNGNIIFFVIYLLFFFFINCYVFSLFTAGSLVTSVMQTMREMKKLQVRYLLPLITCHIESLDLSHFKACNKALVAVRYRCQVSNSNGWAVG